MKNIDEITPITASVKATSGDPNIKYNITAKKLKELNIITAPSKSLVSRAARPVTTIKIKNTTIRERKNI
jgi:hypothetical protein